MILIFIVFLKKMPIIFVIFYIFSFVLLIFHFYPVSFWNVSRSLGILSFSSLITNVAWKCFQSFEKGIIKNLRITTPFFEKLYTILFSRKNSKRFNTQLQNNPITRDFWNMMIPISKINRNPKALHHCLPPKLFESIKSHKVEFVTCK